MNIKYLIQALLNTSTSEVASDSYWNDVCYLLKLDTESNSRGLPLYRDYSRYQYPVREYSGTATNSRIVFIENGDSNYPVLTNTGDIHVESFCYIPNKHNHLLRLEALNTNTTTRVSTVKVSGLETPFFGLDALELGTGDFTIEFSFFADELDLPWKYQSIFTVGEGVFATSSVNPVLTNLNTYITQNSTYLNGWGVFLEDTNLVFMGVNWRVQLNTIPLQKLTWYNVCIQRTDGVLRTFINSQQTSTSAFTRNLNTNYNTVHGIKIGYCSLYELSFNYYTLTDKNSTDLSFSGGISNLRITKASRYPGTFYTLKLPFPNQLVENKIDTSYSDVLFNLPATYDFYNYAPNNAHFKEKVFLQGVPEFNTGYIPITNTNKFETNSISTNLSSLEWTIECFVAPTVNNQLFYAHPTREYGNGTEPQDKTLQNWMQYYQLMTGSTSNVVREVNLISLVANNKPIVELNVVFIRSSTFGAYFAFKASSDGTTWISFPSESSVNFNQYSETFSPTPYILPSNEIKFLPSYSGSNSVDGLPRLNPDSAAIIPNGYSPKPKHIAVQLYNQTLYIFLDGTVVKTVNFPYSLYNYGNEVSLVLGNKVYQDILGTIPSTTTAIKFGLAVKGVRVTNKARYATNTTNNVHYLNSVQPLPLSVEALPPSRARVIDLVKTDTSYSVSRQEISWEVYLSQPVDNLTLADFTLSGVDGITGYSLVSLTKNSNYKYTVVADTGNNNGSLTLNFLDRKTVKYAGYNLLISNYVGELNLEGETYLVNKNNPVPILSSGSNPYVNNDFVVRLFFDSTISEFYPENIGVINGVITNIDIVDADNNSYDLTVSPVAEGLVIVKCIEGVAINDSGLISTESESLIRIYSLSFPILQLPLNTSRTKEDVSPSNIALTDVIPNNTVYTATEYPPGTDSVLSVNPNLEQSGLFNLTYDSVASSITDLPNEWTIEFYLRINSTLGTRRAHIFSVENPSTGFCIYCDNTNMRIIRSVSNTTNLLGITMKDIETPSYSTWSNVAYTQIQKFPHFAITYVNGTYRFYRNGIRQALVSSAAIIDITKGALRLGYYAGRLDDVAYLLSNVRFTVGKALYTAYQVNIPALPYEIMPDISEEAELLSYISIYSNNATSYVAKTNDTVTLIFSSIFPLENVPVVTILGRAANLTHLTDGRYKATVDVLSSDNDGQIPFSITVANEQNIPTKVFSSTTNGSTVFIDNEPLTATFSTEAPDDGSYSFSAFLTFSEEVKIFTQNDLTLVNCQISNLRKILNSNIYSFVVTAINNGVISVSLDAGKIEDLAGNYNLVSNTLSRTVTVPAYVVDPYFNDVLLLLQPTTNIVDESNANTPLTVTNVSIVNTHSPANLSKSMYFNGESSSIDFTLTDSLSANVPYTVEFYTYFKSNVSFRLSKPIALPPSNLKINEFTANWNSVANADTYVLDVSREATFNSYLSGYNNLNVGDVTTLPVTGEALENQPAAKPVRLDASFGFLAEWSYPQTKSYYKFDVSLDSSFTKRLYLYSDKATTTSYAKVGDLTNYVFNNNVSLPSPDTDETLYNPNKGVLLNGILGAEAFPRIYYVLEEDTLRVYPSDTYSLPVIAEEVAPGKWYHVALVSDGNYTKLWVDGELQGKIKTISIAGNLTLGYSIGHFYGYLTGLRITKGVARYISAFSPPSLPFSKG